MPSFYEFFAGGGMARVGLGGGWRCLFANDIDPRKAAAYRANFGDNGELWVGDVHQVPPERLQGRPDLVWGSFPCQDLSLAGAGAGLAGARSSAIYGLFERVAGLAREGRAPAIVALENVVGTLSARGGADFAALCAVFVAAGYRPGALVVDAERFVPQSRPRLFLIGVRPEVDVSGLAAAGPCAPFHPPALVRAAAALPETLREAMLWWRLPPPPLRTHGLADLIEGQPRGVGWFSAAKTERLLAMMSPLNREKVRLAGRGGQVAVGGVYRRTRVEDGDKVQRAEVRFDAVSGCLRTPAGGSSRQMILVVQGEQVRARLISPRETARLMGLPDSYILPARYNEAYHLTGDGVVAPVVRHLARHLFEPLLAAKRAAAA